jgi:APA family basic amino acid/polyamine antiporter
MDLETLVAIANGFFIGNAMIGLAASVKILDTLPYRAGALALLLSFTGLLAFMEAGTFVGYSVILLAVVVTTKKTGQLVVDSTSISDKACRESGQI